MSYAPHRDTRIQRLTIGREREPLLVIDNVFAEPDQIFELAASRSYVHVSSHYPGVRAKVPLSIQLFLLDVLRGECMQAFELGGPLRFTSCHFSLVTTPPEQLAPLQRIPHVDSVLRDELAMILYLFKREFGGTAFYRHRKSGFEFVDETRKVDYFRYVEQERDAIVSAGGGYIGGDTPYYERVGRQTGVFNRMLVYRRTSLHSGDFGPDFVLSADPRHGRLSINGFIA